MNSNVQSQYLRIEMALIYLFAALLAVTCIADGLSGISGRWRTDEDADC